MLDRIRTMALLSLNPIHRRCSPIWFSDEIIEASRFDCFKHIIGWMFAQHFVTVLTGGVEAAMLIPVVSPFDYGVFILAIVSTFVPHMIELSSPALRTWIVHPFPILSFDIFDVEG